MCRARQALHKYPTAFNTTNKPCDAKLCKNCTRILPGTYFSGTYNNRRYKCRTYTPYENVTCKTKNVVYLITCKTCNIKYVGETGMQLNSRMNGHVSSIKFPEKASCKFLAQHFNQGHCREFYVQIIEKIADSSDKSQERKLRQEREEYYIRLLKTKFPYGLNEKFHNDNDQLTTLQNLELKKKRPKNKKRGRRKPRSLRNKVNVHTLLSDVITHPGLNIGEGKRIAFQNIMCLSRAACKKLFMEVDCTNDQNELVETIKDLCETRIHRFENEIKKKRPEHLLRIKYVNRHMEDLKLNTVFKINTVSNLFPADLYHKAFQKPTVIWSYNRPASSWIFNYKQAAIEMNVLNVLTKDYDCNCDRNNSFKNVTAGHVVTGRTAVVNNTNLESLLNRGVGFRIPAHTSIDSCIQQLRDDLEEYCQNISNDDTLIHFTGWIDEVIRICNNRLITSKKSYGNHGTEISFIDKKELRILKDKYVFTKVDKAAQNYAIVCKTFYLKTLSKELGLEVVDGNLMSSSDTYELVNSQIQSVIENLKTKSEQLGVVVENRMLNLSYMYLLPKFHKPSLKFRPIVASSTCVTKNLSFKLAIALKLVLNRIKNYCATVQRCTRINMNWITRNNNDILQTLEKLSNRKNARCIQTYDFTTLYTSIDHDDLMNALDFITNIAYKSSRHKLIRIYNKSARWDNKESHGHTLSQEDLMQWCYFLISSTFIQIGHTVVRQNKGIPMGTNAAPQIADLYLAAQELKFMKARIRTDFGLCFSLRHTYRYLDDITIINDTDKVFESHYPSIYHDCLKLEKVNETDNSADVLDISVSIKDNKFHTTVFDKRRSFPFNVVHLPAPDSNISVDCMYSVFYSQVFRFARICSNADEFQNNCNKLAHMLLAKGYSKRKLKLKFEEFLRKNKKYQEKFQITRPSQCSLTFQ